MGRPSARAPHGTLHFYHTIGCQIASLGGKGSRT